MNAPWLAEAPTALYRLYSSVGDLLYIGIANNPEARWAAHAADKSWWPEVSRKEVEWHGSRRLAAEAEVAAIKSEPSRYNGTHSPWNRAVRKPADGEITVVDARANLSKLHSAVQLLRRVYFLTSRGSREAALVPAELGEAVLAVGGADAAIELLTKAAKEQP